MRVTPETRLRTRALILEAAHTLFARDGFAAATTRQVARAAGIASGTLFNYFPSKEALGIALLADAGAAAEEELARTRRPGTNEETLEEALFAHVATELRHLAPFRSWLPEVLAAGWSPLADAPSDSDAVRFRQRHLERVAALLTERVPSRDPGADLVDQHLYWTLYLGVLSFWSRDDSEHQQATLALLDRSMGLYARALRERETGG